jgi:Fe-S oxidoreductase/FAD/FMN-containing dehydrogenase
VSKLKELNAEALASLKSIDGLRLNLSQRERHMYESDIAELPSMPKLMVGRTVPSAIVQPRSEDEVIAVVEWAAKNHVQVVPRAAATSGYGGVVPPDGAVVIELIHLDRVLSVDQVKMTATVEPGIVWKHLAFQLAFQGLAPRMVPTSAPGSTVGGWLAQGGGGGGGGFGSYQYGWFEQNVESATLINPDGSRRVLTGRDLALVGGAMGTTGIITSMTIRLRKNEADRVFAIEALTISKVQEIIVQAQKQGLPLWHAGFFNPTAARLKNMVPAKLHGGEPHPRPVLPESYIMMLACPESKAAEVEPKLKAIVSAAGASWLPDWMRDHEWEDRYNPMKAKRIGPSIVPAEVVIPLSSLAIFFNRLDAMIKPPVVVEATVVKGEEVILLCLIPHDRRKFTFNIAFTLSLSILRLAKRLGGRAYASGLFLGQEARAVHGMRLKLWQDHKRNKDDQDLFNPKKISGLWLMKIVITLALWFEPFVRVAGNMVRPQLREVWKAKAGIPGDLIWYAYACAGCGYCRQVCTQYDAYGWESTSPRGKWTFIRQVVEGKDKFDKEATDSFLMCTTCERCDFECQLDLPLEPSWDVMRGELVNTGKQMTFPALELMAASVRKENNVWASFAVDRDKWIPDDLRPKIKDKAEIAYFAGCTASFVEPDAAIASARLLDAAGIEFTTLGKDEACCGIPMLVAGRWDVFEEILRHNIAKMKEKGVKTVVASCPSCWLTWHTYYPQWAKKLGIEFDIEAKNYSEVLADKLDSGELKFTHPVDMTVTFHDSCHMGRGGGIYEPPRKLLEAIPGIKLVEMAHNHEDALCCGSVVTRIGEPEPTSNILGKRRVGEAIDTGADALVALCPCCEFQFRVSADVNHQKMPVKDLAALAAQGLGINLPDSTDYVLELWAVLDKVITLMQTENMAKLMTMLIPSMIRALPLPLRGMMQLAKVPVLDKLMAAMMPGLMPLLMPILMPKVMPEMLGKIESMIAMPDQMRKQMPDLMPKVMDNMMPHVLPEIAKIVTPAMIGYIKTKTLPQTAIF